MLYSVLIVFAYGFWNPFLCLRKVKELCYWGDVNICRARSAMTAIHAMPLPAYLRKRSDSRTVERVVNALADTQSCVWNTGEVKYVLLNFSELCVTGIQASRTASILPGSILRSDYFLTEKCSFMAVKTSICCVLLSFNAISTKPEDNTSLSVRQG